MAPAPTGEETEEAPPTVPEAAAVVERLRAQLPEPSLQSPSRLPQGLGGPNIAAPTALERLRARNAVRPGIDGIGSVPRLARLAHFEGDVAVMALRHRLSLQPEIVRVPPMQRRASSIMPSLARFSLVLLVASSVALTVALLTLPDTRQLILKTESGPVAMGITRPASVPAAPQPSPRLIGVEGRKTYVNEALALGISLNGGTGSEFAFLTGLVSGTRLSVGSPFGANGWRLQAGDLAGALAHAPKDFVGVMNAAIDLRLPDDRLVDSRVMRLEWIPRQLEAQVRSQPPKAEPPKAEEAPKAEEKPVVVLRTIDQAELAALVKRGQEYLQTGDIVSARLMLRRAASAGSAQAALMLGASYDPIVLRDLGVLGFSPDPEQARTWYERAAEYGSAEASRRLDRLANVAR